MTKQDKKTVELAMGRIFGMMLRPGQAGDVAEYERCRKLIMDLAGDGFTPSDSAHCYVRDRNKGAQGD